MPSALPQRQIPCHTLSTNGNRILDLKIAVRKTLPLQNGNKSVTMTLVFARQIRYRRFPYMFCNSNFNCDFNGANGGFDCGALFQMLSKCFGFGC